MVRACLTRVLIEKHNVIGSCREAFHGEKRNTFDELCWDTVAAEHCSGDDQTLLDVCFEE